MSGLTLPGWARGPRGVGGAPDVADWSQTADFGAQKLRFGTNRRYSAPANGGRKPERSELGRSASAGDGQVAARHHARGAVALVIAREVGVHSVAAPGAGKVVREVLLVVGDGVPHDSCSFRFSRGDFNCDLDRSSFLAVWYQMAPMGYGMRTD